MKAIRWGQLADHEINQEDEDVYSFVKMTNIKFWDDEWYTNFRLEIIME